MIQRICTLLIAAGLFLSGECEAQPGSLDTTFSNHGIFYHENGVGGFTRLLVQPDSRIVGGSLPDWVISRYFQDGSPDSSFGTGGYSYAFNFYGSFEDLALQPDGKILTIGQYPHGYGDSYPRIARLNSNGSLDRSFASQGYIDFTSDIMFYSVLAQPDNKILIGGTVRLAGDSSIDIIIHRLNQDGSWDLGFGSGGKISFDYLGATDKYTLLDLQGDGKILVSFTSWTTHSETTIVLRYTPEGNPDDTFGNQGIVIIDSNLTGLPVNHINSLLVRSDIAIVLAGYAGNINSLNQAALVKLDREGHIDSTFGTHGFRLYDSIPSFSVSIIQWSNKIIGSDDHNHIYRINQDGSLDTTFGVNGRIISRVNPGDDWEPIFTLANKADDRILAGGVCQVPDPNYGKRYVYYMEKFLAGLVCPPPVARFNYHMSDTVVLFSDLSLTDTLFHWDFGDGTFSSIKNPVHKYPTYGNYMVCLDIKDSCGNTANTCDTVKVIPNTIPELSGIPVTIYPNPAGDRLYLLLSEYHTSQQLKIIIFNSQGVRVLGKDIDLLAIQHPEELGISLLNDGCYTIQLITNQHSVLRKFIKCTY